MLQRSAPRTILMRHSFHDGFSDQVFAHLGSVQNASAVRCVVLVAAGTPPAAEARQVSLGADCVLRDPVRPDLLLAYLDRYQRNSRQRPAQPPTGPASTVAFAGGLLHRLERKLQHGGRTTPLTPREIELIELLVAATGGIVTYETLYDEILNRPFRGDTGNMRVLLGKLTASAAAVGLMVRDSVEVIPKAGYRYLANHTATRALRSRVARRQRGARIDGEITEK